MPTSRGADMGPTRQGDSVSDRHRPENTLEVLGANWHFGVGEKELATTEASLASLASHHTGRFPLYCAPSPSANPPDPNGDHPKSYSVNGDPARGQFSNTHRIHLVGLDQRSSRFCRFFQPSSKICQKVL
jgi:hypothetical protein